MAYLKEEVPDQKLWPKGTVPLNCGTCGKLLYVPLVERDRLKMAKALTHDRPDGTGRCEGVKPALIANEIVKVEPMQLPKGALFDLDFRYGKETPDTEFHKAIDAAVASTKKGT